METKHTKGQWVIYTSPTQICVIVDDRSVALIPEKHPDATANARLIAAAPELLEALIMANDVLKATYPLFNEWAESSVIESAINKATK